MMRYSLITALLIFGFLSPAIASSYTTNGIRYTVTDQVPGDANFLQIGKGMRSNEKWVGHGKGSVRRAGGGSRSITEQVFLNQIGGSLCKSIVQKHAAKLRKMKNVSCVLDFYPMEFMENYAFVSLYAQSTSHLETVLAISTSNSGQPNTDLGTNPTLLGMYNTALTIFEILKGPVPKAYWNRRFAYLENLVKEGTQTICKQHEECPTSKDLPFPGGDDVEDKARQIVDIIRLNHQSLYNVTNTAGDPHGAYANNLRTLLNYFSGMTNVIWKAFEFDDESDPRYGVHYSKVAAHYITILQGRAEGEQNKGRLTRISELVQDIIEEGSPMGMTDEDLHDQVTALVEFWKGEEWQETATDLATTGKKDITIAIANLETTIVQLAERVLDMKLAATLNAASGAEAKESSGK
jgi:hypothetical protein